MTLSSQTVNAARFWIHGRAVTVVADIKGTTGGTATNNLTLTVPVNRTTTTAYQTIGMVGSIDGNGVLGGGAVWNNTSQSQLLIFKYDESNFGLGVGRGVSGTFSYEI